MRLIDLDEQEEDSFSTPPWYTTYSDMMTLLLAFFVLMYSLSANKTGFEEFLKSFNEAIVKRQGVVGPEVRRKGPGSGILKTEKSDSIKPQKFGLTEREIKQMEQTKKQLDQYIASLSNGSKINSTITERGLVIRFAGNLLFESGKADIRPEAMSVLTNVAAIIKDKGKYVRVEGFTDNRPINSSRYPSNWELSTARATAVLRYLINFYRMDPNRLSAAGYGEYRALYPNDSDHNRSLNRRVDIVLLYPSLEIREPKK